MARDQHAAVLAANDDFYRAFESLEIARMEAVWLRVPYVTCVHPGWSLLAGWGPVMESWQRIFTGALAMRFTITDARAEVAGDVAWVVCTEHLESHHRDARMTARVQATNLFQRREGHWYLVHHHGSPVSPPFSAPVGSTQMH